MTTFVQYTPSQTSPFQFQPTFDGQTCNVIVTANYFGQRNYLNVYDQNGNLSYCLPMIASPDDYDININAGYFKTTLIYRASSNNFEIGD